MLWIAAIVSFGMMILELMQFLWNAIPYYRIHYLGQGGTVEIGFERYGWKAAVCFGVFVLSIMLIKLIHHKMNWHEDSEIYEIAENTSCTYHAGIFVDKVTFYYKEGKIIKGETIFCDSHNIEVEYDQTEPWIKRRFLYKTSNWFTNLMVFAFLYRYEKVKVNMPPERINYV